MGQTHVSLIGNLGSCQCWVSDTVEVKVALPPQLHLARGKERLHKALV
jgi:hypothetical protein